LRAAGDERRDVLLVPVLDTVAEPNEEVQTRTARVLPVEKLVYKGVQRFEEPFPISRPLAAAPFVADVEVVAVTSRPRL
jgi:hypothetical protein